MAARPTARELSTVAAVAGAGSFAYGGPTTDSLTVLLTGAVVALTPGPVTAAIIQTLGRASGAEALLTGLGLAVAGIGLRAAAGARLGRRYDLHAVPALGAYFGTWAVAAVVLRDPFAAVAAAVPAAGAVHIEDRTGHRDAVSGRRAVFLVAAGVFALAGVAGVVGLRRADIDSSPSGSSRPSSGTSSTGV